jgi:hypothetical protein
MFIAYLGMWLLWQDPALSMAIERLRAGRDFQKARVTWVIDPAAGTSTAPRYGVHTYAGDQVMYEFHYPTMAPQTQLSDYSIYQGLSWEGGYLEGQGDVRLWNQWDNPKEAHGPQINFRRLGMDVGSRVSSPGLPLSGKAKDLKVATEGNLVVVSGQDAAGQLHKWYLDPAKGYGVVESQVIFGSQVISKAVSDLKRWGDGVWYPESVQYYATGPEGELRLRETLRVLEFACDTPDLPARLTPQDAGVDVGTNITRVGAGGDKAELMIWDGEKPTPLADFHRRLRAGELRMGDRFNAAVARMRAYAEEQHRLERVKPSLWEQYVREFIHRHRLDEAQTRQAWAFHDECKKQAEGYLSRHKKEFDAYEKQADRLRQEPDREAQERLDGKRREVEKPVEEIFDRLVSRLESLLPPQSRPGEPSTSRPRG